MGTRSNIGIVNTDKSITSIYCHWDGYPEYVGRILLNYYTTSDRVNKLMQLGNLSQLCEDMCPTESHTFDKPEPGVCVAYGRDRGERNVDSVICEDLGQYEDLGGDTGTSYQYLFEDNKWMYRNTYKDGWSDLTPEICK